MVNNAPVTSRYDSPQLSAREKLSPTHKRAKHICSWKAHNSHINENDVFYAELDGTVTEFYHLTVPKEYCEVHMMHTYGKALLVHKQEVVSVNVKVIQDRTRPGRINHVKITGNWKKFAGRCGFILGKMMRLKLINTIVEMVEGEEIQVAVFHDYDCMGKATWYAFANFGV
ncbi:hypothetical protein CTI12_AA347060 [Artemisia annua]|uniref:DNA-binding pseudobarrel domain-containing protein n=1 Tax=Artemisia annua TaxID=35608 RepID=A0A2U1MRJ8_ARTAN|nr:hypothetical protein CTI12_AA347060 [Artemisia annua]